MRRAPPPQTSPPPTPESLPGVTTPRLGDGAPSSSLGPAWDLPSDWGHMSSAGCEMRQNQRWGHVWSKLRCLSSRPLLRCLLGLPKHCAPSPALSSSSQLLCPPSLHRPTLRHSQVGRKSLAVQCGQLDTSVAGSPGARHSGWASWRRGSQPCSVRMGGDDDRMGLLPCCPQAPRPLPSPQPPAQPLPAQPAASPAHSGDSSDACSPLKATEGQSK